ncbi:MAG: hypothetical protein KAW67_09680, partial [Candidatus Eisenbacteria sp.]|nr:hypothetical protein [Candidatus Eisenbacteria bacterium]
MSYSMRSGFPFALAPAACAAALIATVLLVIPTANGARADTPEGYFVSVEELKRGDRCIGRTVFVGTEVEEFELEILGVVRGAAPGTDLIIGRAGGGLLESTGILEGMSGSPVYKDGRLIGAIASTWQFSKEPIAGITPIGEMLPALELMDAEGHASGRPGLDGLPGLAMLPDGERAASSLARICDMAGMLERRTDAHSVSSAVAFGDRRLAPIAAPLVVSGAKADYVYRACRILGPGVTPLLGSGVAPGAAARTDIAPGRAAVPESSLGAEWEAGELEPGSAVGIQFVR